MDTGATYTVVSASLLRRLGGAVGRRPFQLADSRQAEYEVGMAQVRVDGRTHLSPVAFGPEGGPYLLGAVTLEILGLAAAPVRRKPMPVPGLLM